MTISSLSSPKISTYEDVESQQKTIINFKGKEHIFSNLYPCKINIYTHKFNSSEACFQYRKAIYNNEFQKAENILYAKTSNDAMDIGNSIPDTEGWDMIKDTVMKEIQVAKAEQVEAFKAALIDSKGAILQEDTTHIHWAKGENGQGGLQRLGHILMEVRANLLKEEIISQDKSKDHQHKKADRPEIHIVGNSLTYNLKLLDLNEANVNFHPAPNIQKAEAVISRISPSAETILIQEITNDTGYSHQNATNCAQRLKQLAIKATSKAKHVIVSMAPPNGNKQRNELIFTANNHAEHILKNNSRVHLCKHENLGYNGFPNYELLGYDQTHLSPKGKQLYARNLSSCIRKVMQLNT